MQASSATEDNTTTDEANASLDGAASGNESLLDNISSTIYGDRECPCMQLDKLPYTINITMISAEAIVEYPADVGGHCQAWDDGVAPSCEEGGTPGEGQDWCAKKWCYVDPCSCNISIQPKASNYFPTAFLDGRPLYYSYATCGDEVDAELVKEDDSAMCSTPSDEKIVGSSDCSCIGIAELPGTRPIYADGAYADYPGGAGSSCQAWDMDRHPDCVDINGSAPEWCSQPWCFVDPCSCDVAAEPATYLPGAKFQGKPLYYSYSTCGGIDTYNNETGTQNYTGNCEAWPVVPKGGSNIGVIVGVVVAVVVVAAVVFAVAA